MMAIARATEDPRYPTNAMAKHLVEYYPMLEDWVSRFLFACFLFIYHVNIYHLSSLNVYYLYLSEACCQKADESALKC